MTEAARYISREKNRHGNECIYYRRRGRRVRIRALFDTDEFSREIQRATESLKKGIDLLPETPASSFVYFILLGHAKVKIGTARNPQKRFESLRAGVPGKARLYYVTPGGYELERLLHNKFMSDRVSGEWFIYSQQIRDWISADEKRRLEARQP